MSDKEIQIKLTGKVGYEDSITVAQAASIIAFLNDGTEGALGVSQGFGGLAGGRGGSTVSGPRAALDASGAKTNPQKIVALAAYVLQDGGVETFKLDAVKVQFQRAREAMPKNLSRDLTKAIAAGWIEESDVSGEYYLTHAVDKVLVDGFGDGGASVGVGSKTRSSSGRSRKSSNGAKPKKPDVFAGMDEFPVSMNGYPSYHKMKSNRDRLLWALKFAKDREIKGLQNKDVAWLTDHLGEGILNKQITATFNSAQKPGYATRSTMDNTLRITPDGEEFLASLGGAS